MSAGMCIDGARLRALRLQRGLSQRALGDLAGVAALTIGRMERGTDPVAKNPTMDTVRRVAAALGVLVAELLPEADRIDAAAWDDDHAVYEPSAAELWTWLLMCLDCGYPHREIERHPYRMRARSVDVLTLYQQWTGKAAQVAS